ncbi:1-phosphofructokinase [Robertmurraya korlensis]|uniref:1-phosphofructokinase n=1 Tax=Robertmurraya korlensis TaxID=519977 RepID=UPI002041A45F|nr:1-phosphofructokinase [Robertmurraya korlensis]MCM3599974.1 1-phosphofructokinase [Robertmurraya korlensis]
MIYTVTLNPSLDYIVEVEDLTLGDLNRTKNESKFPGGKGINVSRLLKRMGVPSKALGFVGGFTGLYIKNYLKREDIETKFVDVQEDTRINVKLKSNSETEVNAKGPTITEADFKQLQDQISQLTSEDTLVLAGSIPSSMESSTYEKLVSICQLNQTKFVVDAEGDLLKKVLPFKPFLIKPNHHELGELFNTSFSTAEEVVPYARKLVEMGAENVIVSLAGEGAVLVNREVAFLSNVPKGEVKSSVGAGDSMVAGFLAKYEETKQIEEAFRYSVASGSATAFSIGLATKEMIETLYTSVYITKF